MKKIRIVLAVFMLALTGMAWVSLAGGIIKDDRAYGKALAEARALEGKQLYQKEIAALEEALDIRETVEARCLWRDAWQLAWEDGVVARDAYLDAMESVVKLQPDNVENWERLIGFCVEAEDFKTAYACCKDAEEAGVSSGKLDAWQRQVRYSYSVNGRVYSKIRYSPSGYNTVCNGDKWGVLDQDGEWAVDCTWEFLSPVASGLVRLTGDASELRIVDNKSVVQAILGGGVEAAGVVADGIVPVLEGGSWRYYDSAGSGYLPGSYEEAAAFAGGIAAVKEGGKWKLTDKNGSRVGDAEFEDIKLYGSGEYLYDGAFVAKSGGAYGLYDRQGEPVAGISGGDMDVSFGEWIACRDPGGKWGYMDKKGKVMIEPQYDEAKSFSNGLAAVCIDGMWGFINEDNELVIENRFLDTGYFTSGGLCFVSEVSGEYYMITLRFPER